MTSKKNIKEFVARAVFIKNGLVLLVNKMGEPHYFLPGGRLEFGEGISTCLIREIEEELNLPCKIKNYVGAIEHLFEDETKTQYEVGHFFTVDIPGLDPSQPPKSADGELRFCWVEISKLENLDMRPPPVIDMLKAIASGQKSQTFWASTITDS